MHTLQRGLYKHLATVKWRSCGWYLPSSQSVHPAFLVLDTCEVEFRGIVSDFFVFFEREWLSERPLI